MDRIAEILAILNGDGALAGLSDEEVAALETELLDLYAQARTEPLTAEGLATLSHVADSVDALRGEASERLAAAEALAEQAAALDARLTPVVAEEGDEEPEVEVEEEAPVEEPEPEPAPEEAETPIEEPVAVAAAATPPAPTPLATLATRQPARTRPRPAAPAPRATMRAAAGLASVGANGEFGSDTQVAEAMIEAWDANMGTPGGAKVPVARVRANYDEDHRLSGEFGASENGRRLRRAADEFSARMRDEGDALVAAGGICAPTSPYYDLAMISHASRPVRDSLVQMNADRGGINWITPPSLASIGTSGGSPNQAIDQITEAEDAANALKPYQRVACGSPQTATIYAVPNILEFGNLMQRTFPEEVRTWTDLSVAAHARYAENLLLTAIAAGSTAVTTQQDLGAARDILNMANLAAVAYRNRHRMPVDASLRAMLPDWIVGMIQNDMWSALNVGQDPASITRQDIARWFRFRNINVTFFEDGVGPGSPAYQQFPTQSAGALNNWPTVVQWYLFHEGAWAFLDGGTLDLGVVRDSSLNEANKFRTFVETFEQVAFLGIESLRVRSTICANGATAGTINPNDLCDGGS